MLHGSSSLNSFECTDCLLVEGQTKPDTASEQAANEEDGEADGAKKKKKKRKPKSALLVGEGAENVGLSFFP